MPPLARGVTWRLPPTCRAHRGCNPGARFHFSDLPGLQPAHVRLVVHLATAPQDRRQLLP